MINNNEYTVAIIIGTRAELIKTFPFMLELQKRRIPYYFVHTGQHSLGDLCDTFSVKRPDVVLTEEPKKGSKFNTRQTKAVLWNIIVIPRIRQVLKNLSNLKYVFYHGDTMTTLSAAIASSKLLNWNKKYKNVHLEGGLRSFNKKEPFPEEISRIIADNFSDVIIAVSPFSLNNIKQYKGKKEIFLLGNTIIDSATYALNLAKKRNIPLPSQKKFALISIHRHENLKNKKRMARIIEILDSLKIPAYFAMHDNTKVLLERYGLLSKLKRNKNIILAPTVNYISYINQIAHCSLILADGGSIQEESLIFKKPCIILRNATERQEGLDTNFQFLSKFNVKKTKEKIREYLSPKFKIKSFQNPYGKMGVSKRIVERLIK